MKCDQNVIIVFKYIPVEKETPCIGYNIEPFIRYAVLSSLVESPRGVVSRFPRSGLNIA